MALDRNEWMAASAEEAINVVRTALRTMGSPYAEIALTADLLDYVDDGVWLIIPAHGAPVDADVSAMVDVRTGSLQIGSYRQVALKGDLGCGY